MPWAPPTICAGGICLTGAARSGGLVCAVELVEGTAAAVAVAVAVIQVRAGPRVRNDDRRLVGDAAVDDAVLVERQAAEVRRAVVAFGIAHCETSAVGHAYIATNTASAAIVVGEVAPLGADRRTTVERVGILNRRVGILNRESGREGRGDGRAAPALARRTGPPEAPRPCCRPSLDESPGPGCSVTCLRSTSRPVPAAVVSRGGSKLGPSPSRSRDFLPSMAWGRDRRRSRRRKASSTSRSPWLEPLA